MQALPDRYYVRAKPRRGQRYGARPIDDYRQMRPWGMSAQEHKDAAIYCGILAAAIDQSHAQIRKVADKRLLETGAPEEDLDSRNRLRFFPPISGGLRHGDAGAVKDFLRGLAHAASECRGAAFEHEKAARVATRWNRPR